MLFGFCLYWGLVGFRRRCRDSCGLCAWYFVSSFGLEELWRYWM